MPGFPAPSPRKNPDSPNTLVIDIGGTGLKATVLDAAGQEVHERVRAATAYPCPPDRLIDDLVTLTTSLSPHDRASAGFPGVIRDGRVLTAPHFVTPHGPGTGLDPSLAREWSGFDLATALTAALGVPTRVGNDADVQGLGVVTDDGLALVLTLGTGLGSAVFRARRLALHLELAHHPGPSGISYNDYVGDAARAALGAKRWNRRVRKSLAAVDALIFPDSIYIGGGNAEHVEMRKLTKDDPALAGKVRIVGNEGGLLGGIRLWDDDSPA